MTKPDFKNWVTSGNVITLAGMALAAAVAWGVYTTQLKAMTSQITDHEERIRIIERISIEGLARIDQRLTNIERSIP